MKNQSYIRHLIYLSGFCLAFGAYFLFAIRSALIAPDGRSRDVSGAQARSAFDAFFLYHWASYIDKVAVQAKDRSGFAEMGFRTEMYIHLLRHSELLELDYFEKILWPFAPGIKALRQVHTDKKDEERGLIISVGKSNYLFAIHLISSVRKVFKSNIVIEIYYYGETDLPLDIRDHIKDTFDGIRFIDLALSPFFDHEQLQMDKQGYALKPLAALSTNLSEFILLDADAVLLTSPDSFFKSKDYQETGTLFFRDRNLQREGASDIIHEFISDQLSQRKPSTSLSNTSFWKEKGLYQQESGLLLLDKRRIEIFACLLFAVWQNIGVVREETTYKIFWGDKESFWLAFELAQQPYSFVSRPAGAIGRIEDKENGMLCSEHPLHFLDFEVDEQGKKDGKSRPAWFNGSILHDKRVNNSRLIEAQTLSLDGEWIFLPREERWCMRNFTAEDINLYGLKEHIRSILSTAKSYELKARSLLEKDVYV